MDFTKLVDADKLGGYVRAAVAAGLAELVVHVPTLNDILTSDARAALAIAISTVLVGVWSHIAKNYEKGKK